MGLLTDYVLAQVTAGLVPMPSFVAAPDKAGSRRAPTDGADENGRHTFRERN